jgi:hypothetical protein
MLVLEDIHGIADLQVCGVSSLLKEVSSTIKSHWSSVMVFLSAKDSPNVAAVDKSKSCFERIEPNAT